MAIADKQYAFASSTGKMADLEYRPTSAVKDDGEACAEIKYYRHAPITEKTQTMREKMRGLYENVTIIQAFTADIASEIGVPIATLESSELNAESLSEAIDQLNLSTQICIEGMNEILKTLR